MNKLAIMGAMQEEVEPLLAFFDKDDQKHNFQDRLQICLGWMSFIYT